MILQALTGLYEDLLKKSEIAGSGWNPVAVGGALCLSEDGELLDVVPLLQQVQTEKNKTLLRPQSMVLPAPVKRTAGISANFLWDNASYMLGTDNKDNAKRSEECFRSSGELHRALLKKVDSPAAKAILRYFDSWDPAKARNNPLLLEEIWKTIAPYNLTFRVAGQFAHEDPLIREAWQSFYDQDDGPKMQCLITGKEACIEKTHPAIKNVRGAKSSGAALVSFNADAFCSYGRTQNLNAPVGKYGAFAYTSALNHLLSDRKNVQQIGDATVVCWAEGADSVYQDFSNAVLCWNPASLGLTEEALNATVRRLSKGLPCQELQLNPEQSFYILGLSPNAARLSVRFFLRDTFGNLMKNINDHYSRMEIQRPSFDTRSIVPLWSMLQETVNQKSREKQPSPVMAGAVTRAIFTGSLYPASLLEGVMLRIRAERSITRGRAAIIKAYYLKNQNEQCPKEVLTVSLNEQSANVPYTLGRLFSVYEAVQERANPGINATIKDKYFNTASSSPASVFPLLNKLCNAHLRKLQPGQQVYYSQQISALKGVLGEEYPKRLTLPQQGSFDLGYYHQTQKRYTKKEEQ